MKRIFALYLFLNLTTFNTNSQTQYFVNDSWKNVLKLAKSQNRLVMAYIYSDKCVACDSINTNIISDTTLLHEYSKDIILFKANYSQKIGKSLVNKYYVNQIPSILLILPNGNLFRKLIIGEAIPEMVVSNFIDESNKEFEMYYSYYQDFKNPELIRKYLLQRIGYGNEWKNQQILESYIQKISLQEQETEETLDLILRAGFSLNEQAIEVLYKHLKIAVNEQNLIKQYLIKEKIFESIVETINRGNLESKFNLKKAFQITEQINSISPQFQIYDMQMLELIYHANAKNKSKFMKLAKLYFKKNEPNLKSNDLIKIDSVYSYQFKKNTIQKSIFKINQKQVVETISKFSTNNEASKLTIIAKVILFQQLYQKNIDFGIKCVKKAIELSPSASRFAIHGLLCNKNEMYKTAYESLTKAIELESDGHEKIDVDVSKNAIETYLKIQKRIPEN